MKLRHAAALLLTLPLVFGACRKRPPVVTPPTDTASVTDERDRARADSIRMADEARRRADEQAERDRVEGDRRRREAALAPVREVLMEIVFFEFDSDEITGQAEEKLRAKAEILRANPSLRLRIEGHADQRGSTEYNLALGQRRAESVRAWLTAYGIDESRFNTLSYGKERLLDEGSDEEAFARNRRAEFVITGGQLGTAPEGIR
jgi:peptidoglycan-associated lipoprotein